MGEGLGAEGPIGMDEGSAVDVPLAVAQPNSAAATIMVPAAGDPIRLGIGSVTDWILAASAHSARSTRTEA